MIGTYIEYSISEMMGSPESLLISEDGQARYVSHTNVSERGGVPVGTFAATIPPAQMQSLRSALSSPHFDDLPDHWGQIASGERYKSIRLARPSGRVEKRVGTSRPMPTSTRALFDTMDRIVRDIRHHPLENLQLQLSELVVEPGGQFRAVVALSNPGTVETFCRDPASPGPGMRLKLRASPDRDPLSVRSIDVIEASSIGIRSRAAVPSSSDLLTLRAGASVSYQIGAELPVQTSEPYFVQFLFQNTATDWKDHRILDFELYSAPARLAP